ncbi:hypothetical protein KIL84_009178 [Mauremys mutica]|uniref:Ig-like domain-containing protein n=1 Tax=Mauremys mutica TaxID=74926 RepID=A0A9D4AXP9_9SAUR|nr:hypothetical protein KIL84_009178 [Mauremys mutica]
MFFTSGSVILLAAISKTFRDTVTQTEGTAVSEEGAPLVIECTYESTLFPSLLWYIQHPSKAPTFWLRDKTSGGGQDEGEKQVFLLTVSKTRNPSIQEKLQ